MSASPLVSIIVPVYKVENYIIKCLESIFCQTYTNFEVIFVDDCTPDKSIDLIKKKIISEDLRNIQIIHHSCNRGLSAARNTGVKASKGEYIVHVDSDDYIHPLMIKKMVEEATKTFADIVICGSTKLTAGGMVEQYPKIYEKKDQLIKDILLNNTPGSMWGKLIKREIYELHKDAWSIEGINHGEDYATMPRILFYANKISFIQEPLYYYNQTNVGSYTNNFNKKSLESMIKADKVLSDFFLPIYGEEMIAKMCLRTKVGMVKRGNYKLYPELGRLYPLVTSRYKNGLSKSDQLILFLLNKGFNKLLAKSIQKLISIRN